MMSFQLLLDRRFAPALALACAVTLAGASEQAYAFSAHEAGNLSTESTSSETQQILNFLATYGVSPQTQHELLQKLEAGEPWDSVTGIDPISEERLPNGDILSIYPDGSVAIFSLVDGSHPELPSTALGQATLPQGVSECSFSGSHYAMYWKNCKATWAYGYASFSLRFDYTHDQGGWRITNFWEPLFRSHRGSISNTNVIRYSNTLVTYYADYTSNNGGSHRIKNNLLVHESSAWTENG